MDNFLVTGGAGFIGSNFIKLLLDKNPDAGVVNVDKLTYAGNLEKLNAVSCKAGYAFVKQDICDKEAMRAIFEKYRPAYVVNFAAESHVDRSIEDSGIFVRTNVMGTQVLLQCSLEFGVDKFLQVSTDEVYGPTAPKAYVVESAPLLPGNPYAASKAAGDMLANAYYNTYRLPVLITRSSNNFGPGQHKEKLIPLVIDRCLRCEKIPVYGDGLNTRDWIFVGDNCGAVYSVLEKGAAGQIYNISADNIIENLSLARQIIDTVRELLPVGDLRKRKINEGLIQFVEDRKGHDRGYSISADKIRTELGWKPEQDFCQALEYTVKWYMDNSGMSDVSGGKL